MSAAAKNILILCTGNSARSILGEAMINHHGQGRFRGFSAGRQPKPAPHPLALELLRQMKMSTEGLRSKSWDEFATPQAPKMDFIFTVCDNAAGEACPIWPGHPATAHWGLDDPAAATGTHEQQFAAFRAAFRIIEARVLAFMALPFESFSDDAMRSKLRRIGSLLP